MSDATEFEAIKQSYTQDTEATARQHLSLTALVQQEQKTNSPRLPQDARKLAIFDLAIADLKADRGDGQSAGIMYAEAQALMQSEKIQGLDTVSNQVRRKL